MPPRWGGYKWENVKIYKDVVPLGRSVVKTEVVLTLKWDPGFVPRSHFNI
jgi:hypothetical protein